MAGEFEERLKGLKEGCQRMIKLIDEYDPRNDDLWWVQMDYGEKELRHSLARIWEDKYPR